MKRRAKGLTLIELMVTLAVAIVLLAIGIPAFNSITARDISAATVNALVSALQLARMESISSGGATRVCAVTVPANAGAACDSSAAINCAQTNWGCGWAVVRVSGNTELRRFDAPRKEVIVAVTGVAAPEFNSRGEAGASTFTVRAYRNAGHASADCVRETDVIVTAVGQVRSEVKDKCS